jgi:hypothetical protein
LHYIGAKLVQNGAKEGCKSKCMNQQLKQITWEVDEYVPYEEVASFPTKRQAEPPAPYFKQEVNLVPVLNATASLIGGTARLAGTAVAAVVLGLAAGLEAIISPIISARRKRENHRLADLHAGGKWSKPKAEAPGVQVIVNNYITQNNSNQ